MTNTRDLKHNKLPKYVEHQLQGSSTGGKPLHCSWVAPCSNRPSSFVELIAARGESCCPTCHRFRRPPPISNAITSSTLGPLCKALPHLLFHLHDAHRPACLPCTLSSSDTCASQCVASQTSIEFITTQVLPPHTSAPVTPTPHPQEALRRCQLRPSR